MTKRYITVKQDALPIALVEYMGDAQYIPLLQLLRSGRLYLKTDEGSDFMISSIVQGENIMCKSYDGTVMLTSDEYSLVSPLTPIPLNHLIEVARKEEAGLNTALESNTADEYLFSVDYSHELVFDESEDIED